MNQDSTRKARVNVRRAEVMEQVEKEIQQHYQSELISHIRSAGNVYNLGHTEFFLAREFGFCNGVRRAIDIAYAARRVFPDRRIFLIGDIIHNPEVNRQLEEMGIRKLPWKQLDSSYDRVAPDDVVIIPAFGVPTPFMDALEEKGVQIVDTTCGDVMKVWKRVKNYAAMGITSIIHGKATHEETSATASRALGERGRGKYLVVYDLEDARILCDYIMGRGDREAFLKRFEGCCSPGFDPDRDLEEVGIANQTTMLKTETQTLQKMVKDAELNAAEDHKKVELVQARNQADAMAHSVKKSLAEHGDTLDAAEKEKIEAAIKDVEEAIKGDDKEAIEAKNNALMEASQKLGEKIYAQQAAASGAAPGAAGGGADDTRPNDPDVVDAEVKEVKKD